MSAIPSRTRKAQSKRLQANEVRALIPDFPFDYGAFLAQANKQPLGSVDPSHYGKQVLVVGAGIAGLTAAYEAMRMGLHPVVVDANGRVGGRLYSKVVGAENSQSSVICELGAMRFPLSGKALYHYFEKVGMADNSTDFPNPGTAAALSTVVDYHGEKDYYEEGTGDFPRPDKFTEIENNFFDVFLQQHPIRFTEMERAMSVGTVDQALIKTIWNTILQVHDWDNLSFHAAMVEEAEWSAEAINLFGQIGFGTGGWNTDYPNSFLEVLRVLYTGLDTNHRLMYDGASALPTRLWNSSPSTFGDAMAHWPAGTTVEGRSKAIFANPLRQEVRHIIRQADDQFLVHFHDLDTGEEQVLQFSSVVYTPHVRILDKLRYMGGPQLFTEMNALLSKAQWEAVMYTHYMQSAKIFAGTREAFWKTRGEDGKQLMSITLSDRLTRGTYLVDYGQSTGTYKGSGMFLSYTWNDDSLKFLGDRAAPVPGHVELCTTLLDVVYPGLDVASRFATQDPFVELNWEDQPHFLGAFKMNLPGQYEYQRLLFSQFMEGVGGASPYGFILAGDDVSWTGGWAEGAVTTALNAVDKLAVQYGGSSTNGPISQWEALKPIELAAGPKKMPPHEAAPYPRGNLMKEQIKR
ncbi:flavin monoamine oxidase family protein [Pseudomonas laurentiana]|uniref:flavin monoamine oxidase family protein n=1 Tax=Pseudomonas laurentiana TaxID=2364649 RepID=UPI0016768B05|nr:NAD(P)/FAD-dependent oxidoreductase [Pseudomonas laurentiana]